MNKSCPKVYIVYTHRNTQTIGSCTRLGKLRGGGQGTRETHAIEFKIKSQRITQKFKPPKKCSTERTTPQPLRRTNSGCDKRTDGREKWHTNTYTPSEKSTTSCVSGAADDAERWTTHNEANGRRRGFLQTCRTHRRRGKRSEPSFSPSLQHLSCMHLHWEWE